MHARSPTNSVTSRETRCGCFRNGDRFRFRSWARGHFSSKSFRMNPDLGSGKGISYHAHFKRALIQIEPCRKTADSPVLRQKPVISPGNVSDGESTLPRIQKKNISRDTNHLFSPTPRRRSVMFRGGEARNKPRSEIWAGDSDLRDFHA